MAVMGSSAGTPSVLMVEDDPGLARSLSRALNHLGLRIQLASDGQSALSQLRETRFDVLLLDLQLPGMNGMELLRQASSGEHFPATILHSAYVDVPTAVEAMRAGACEVLQKPTTVAELARRIHDLSPPSCSLTPTAFPGVREVEGEGPETQLLLGQSEAMGQLRESVRRVSRFRDLSVLIEGETGTGKELVARSIHARASKDEPLVSVNCAAIPAELFESELFGHDAGAFTSARCARAGLLEEAGRGVLFLDEVGELPLALQAKLLRVLETREFRRVGSNRTRSFEARVVSATNRRLSHASAECFRQDLYFRIAAHTLRTPALVERLGDIPGLVTHFLNAFAERHGTPRVRYSSGALDALCEYPWPGNVRQLRMVVENTVVHASGSEISRSCVERVLSPVRDVEGTAVFSPLGTLPVPQDASERLGGGSLPDLERTLIEQAYREAGENLSRAARSLGIPRSTLRDRLKRYARR